MTGVINYNPMTGNFLGTVLSLITLLPLKGCRRDKSMLLVVGSYTNNNSGASIDVKRLNREMLCSLNNSIFLPPGLRELLRLPTRGADIKVLSFSQHDKGESRYDIYSLNPK